MTETQAILSIISSIYIGWQGAGKWNMSLLETLFVGIMVGLIIINQSLLGNRK